MSHILVLYGTSYGHTAKVAQRLAFGMMSAGLMVELYRADQLPDQIDPGDFDGIVIAASIIMGQYQPYIREFVRQQVSLLNRTPSAFVSVCGAAGSNPAEAQGYIDTLRRESGWQPKLQHSFAGAVAYSHYAWWYRWYLRLFNRRNGRPTDTTRDWVLTDWAEVDKFAAELASQLVPLPAGVAVSSARTCEIVPDAKVS
jgi:menaquinone-dependent protoporphyrinogen oxidase